MTVEHKGYLISPDKDYPTIYRVAVKGQGGKIPNVLLGMFTSPSVAMIVIDEYTGQKETKRASKAAIQG